MQAIQEAPITAKRLSPRKYAEWARYLIRFPVLQNDSYPLGTNSDIFPLSMLFLLSEKQCFEE